jgi:hypothetical protein
MREKGERKKYRIPIQNASQPSTVMYGPFVLLVPTRELERKERKEKEEKEN